MRQIENFIVNSHDTDINGIVRASALLRYMQETAYIQHIDNPPSLDDYRREQGRTFIISRVFVRSYIPLRVRENIQVSAWIAPSRGVTFTRYAQIKKDGEIAAEMVSNWAMVDINTHALLKVEDQTIGFECDPPLELEMPRLRIPRELALEDMGSRTVYYSDCDLNRHMNNTNYPDMLCDFMPGMEGLRMSEMCLSFLAEAPMGQSVNVLHAAESAEEGARHFFRTVREDGKTGVEAEMRFCEAHWR